MLALGARHRTLHPGQVLEVESLGVKVRNTKRFFVVNPTSVNYEFLWTPAPKAAVAAGKDCSGGQPSPFTCLTRRGVVGAGR